MGESPHCSTLNSCGLSAGTVVKDELELLILLPWTRFYAVLGTEPTTPCMLVSTLPSELPPYNPLSFTSSFREFRPIGVRENVTLWLSELLEPTSFLFSNLSPACLPVLHPTCSPCLWSYWTTFGLTSAYSLALEVGISFGFRSTFSLACAKKVSINVAG